MDEQANQQVGSPLQNKTQQEIDALLEKDIFELLGLSGMKESKKEQMREKMLQTVENRAEIRLLKEIDDRGKMDEYEQIEDGDDEKLDTFFAENNLFPELYYLEEALLYKIELNTIAEIIDGRDLERKDAEKEGEE